MSCDFRNYILKSNKFQPEEIYISSGSDDKKYLMSLEKLLEDFRHFSGRYLR